MKYWRRSPAERLMQGRTATIYRSSIILRQHGRRATEGAFIPTRATRQTRRHTGSGSAGASPAGTVGREAVMVFISASVQRGLRVAATHAFGPDGEAVLAAA